MLKIRIVMTAVALLCLSLPIPAASAGSACHPHTSGAGSGEVWFSNDNGFDAHGFWVDGCGGNKCDDHVEGSYGHGGSFSITEIAGKNDDCTVRCVVDGNAHDMWGYVIPEGSTVSFGCDRWLAGYLDLDPQAVTAYIMYGGLV
ncbi:MAG: hypothetical protein QOE90_3336 [Thermoplasmata archaeon]|nr:hypothetical protein [Thermoplasmata archaeon]